MNERLLEAFSDIAHLMGANRMTLCRRAGVSPAQKVTGMFFMPRMSEAAATGLKTVTRRPMKVQPIFADRWWRWPDYDSKLVRGKSNDELLRVALAFECPYGLPGDLIWPREAYRLNGVIRIRGIAGIQEVEIEYKSSIAGKSVQSFSQFNVSRIPRDRRWRCFLPRWAARWAGEITEVRVERTREMLLRDVAEEGIISRTDSRLPDPGCCEFCGCRDRRACLTDEGPCYWLRLGRCSACRNKLHSLDNPLIKLFADGWNKMHAGARRFECNPWIWVVEFRKTKLAELHAAASAG